MGFILLQPMPQPKPAVQPVNASGLTAKPVNRGLPRRLQIPRLKVDAAVAYMGLTKSGDMDTPTNTKDVGWYKYGSLPGNPGSAVISGHIDGPKGEPAVFAELSKLQIGDQFTVIDSTGRSTSFVVRSMRTYNENDPAPEVFNSREGAHLNLITCSGEWDKVQHHFLKRLVVFADYQT